MGLLRTVRTPEQVAWTEPAGPIGLVASAARVEIKQKRTSKKKKEQQQLQAEWQEEAWHHFNRCGELQYAASWMANSLSRIRLYAAEIGPDGRPGDPTKNRTAQVIASRLFGGPGAAAQVLAALGVHLTVPGDCYIVCEETPTLDDDGAEVTDLDGVTVTHDEWYVISTSELEKKSGKLGIDFGDGWRALSEDSVLIRVWNPHPQKRIEATSATRSVLPVLRELEQLDAHFSAGLDSRLAGNGLLVVPDNIQFKAASPAAQAANSDLDPFIVMLTEAMMTAVDDRDSPAALVPIVVKAPADAIDKIQHISFADTISEATKNAREECIRRLALGMDMPPEALLGQGDTNHWSAWQIEEGGIKVHVEPKAVTVCSALTEEYFRPALKAAGIDNPEDYVLWYDISELVLRPNRAEAAKTLYDADELSAATMLREAGFDPDTDAPDEEERKRRILTKLCMAHPDLAAAILPHLGISGVLPDPNELPAEEIGGGVNEESLYMDEVPDESLYLDEAEVSGVEGGESGAGVAIPATEPTGDAASPAQTFEGGAGFALQASAGFDPLALAREVAIESLVSRGLEYAGKRLLTRDRRGQFGDVDVRVMYRQPGVTVEASKVDRLLDGAFAYVDEVAQSVHLDPAKLHAQLVDHVGGLLTTGAAHERQYSRTIARLCA